MRSVIFVLLLVLASAGLPAFAANEVFTVRNVPVDATADGASAARARAHAEGQRAAYNRLARRLTRQQDWSFLPNPTAEALTGLVLGVEVAEERSSQTRYFGKVTYSFRPVAVRNLLRGAGIPFSETQAKPALVLPVLQSSGGTVLFGDDNPWRAEWAKRDLSDELVPMLAPLNDLDDARLVSGEQALSATWQSVEPIARKYGLERVIIAHASARGALGSSQLDVKVRQLSPTQDTSTTFNFAAGGDAATTLSRAVDASLNRLYEEWKATTIVASGQQSSLIASAWFGTLQDWLTLRQRLGQAPAVSSFDVLGLSRGGAELRLRYAGTPSQLGIALEQVSLILADVGGRYEIALAERGLRNSRAGLGGGDIGVTGDYAAPGAPVQPKDLPPNTN